jgi:hypothetical protein
MAQIGNIPEINEVKTQLDILKEQQLIRAWELPYENLLTRLTAAIFFLEPADETKIEEVWTALEKYPLLDYKKNEMKTLSALSWQVEFNKGFQL